MTQKVLLFCGGTVFYGKEIVTLRLAHGLRRAGWDVGFITSHWNSAEVTRRLQESGLPCRFLWLGFLSLTLRRDPIRWTIGQLQKWPRMLADFYRITRDKELAAVVHTNWQHALLLLLLLKPQRDIFWLHETIPSTARYAVVMRAIAKRVGSVICVSRAVAATVESAGVPKAKIHVVYNGVEIADAPASRVATPVLRLGIVGQVNAWKGHEDLIDALARLVGEGVQARLSIFGGGPAPYLTALKARIVAASLDDRVEWRGFVGDPAAIYQAVDVCVLPTRTEEPLSTAAIEASAAGLPVICTKLGGFPEIVEHGVTGLLVEPRRPDLLAQAIAQLAASPARARAMGEAGRQRAQKLFALSRFVGEFERILRAL